MTLTFALPEDAYDYWVAIQKLISPHFMAEIDYAALKAILK